MKEGLLLLLVFSLQGSPHQVIPPSQSKASDVRPTWASDNLQYCSEFKRQNQGVKKQKVCTNVNIIPHQSLILSLSTYNKAFLLANIMHFLTFSLSYSD